MTVSYHPRHPVAAAALSFVFPGLGQAYAGQRWIALLLAGPVVLLVVVGLLTALVFGAQKINVRPKDADKVEWFTADHQTAGSDDLCFLTSSTPDEVVAHLKANGVAIEEGPAKKQGARGTILSVYCRDPDGSLIEISSYETS